MKEFTLQSFDNKKLFCYLYDNAKNPKGIIIIIHGMQEYARRYEYFASVANKNGYIVFASDLRGHGKTAIDKKYGIDNGDIFDNIVKDQNMFIDYLLKMYNLPIYVLGHSFGSFIGQRMILNNTKVEKFILSGSTFTLLPLYKIGKFLSKVSFLFGRKYKTARLLEGMSLKGYGRKYPNGNWLSRDDKIMTDYRKDPLCGMAFPNYFYYSMFDNQLRNYEGIEKVNKSLPILLIGGSMDPVSSKSKNLTKLYEYYKQAGLNVELKIFEGARHEVLNEINKEEVMERIFKFIKD